MVTAHSLELNFPTQLFMSPYFLVPIGTLTLYVMYYLKHAVKKPELHCAKGHFHNFIKASCPVIEEHYWPSVWCFHSHALTSFSNVFRTLLPKLPFHREYLVTPDGGEISIDWYDPEGKQPQTSTRDARPISLILPGLTGHSHAEYLRIIIPKTHEAGLRPVVLNYRGLGGNKLKTPRLYCACNHDDLKTVLQHLRSTVPDPEVKIFATGLSLGATILGSYLTASGEDAQVDAACLISACWDYHKGSIQLDTGILNPRVNRLLTSLLQGVAQKHRKFFEDLYDMEAMEKARGLRAFDEAITRRMFGYASTDEYYTDATQAGKLAKIKVPTLCINAGDDMLAPTADLPLEEVRERTSHVAMLVTARGGHIGFMEGPLPRLKPSFYLERVYAQYMDALARLPENPRHLFSD